MITQFIRLQKNVPLVLTFEQESIFSGLRLYELTTLPAWIVSGGLNAWISFLSMNPPTLGTFTYYFTLGGSPSNSDACLIIEVVDSLTESVSTCVNSNTITLIWINKEGGRSSYIFDQRKDYAGLLGESSTYDNGGVVKYSTRGKSFEVKTVYKTGLSNNEVDLVESLRNSIQAWEYNTDTDVSTPILLDLQSYSKYNTKNKLNEISIKYRIGAYKQVQAG